MSGTSEDINPQQYITIIANLIAPYTKTGGWSLSGNSQSEKAIERKSIYLICVIVIIAGVLSLAISTALLSSEFLREVVRDTGIALVIAGSVGLSLEYHLKTHTLKGIEHSISEIVDVVKDVIHKEETLLKECGFNGLLKVYEPHSKSGRDSDFDRDIVQQLQSEADELKIYAISGRHFFHHERKYYAELRAAAKSGVLIKALLIDPFSEAAKKRARLEEDITKDNGYFQSKVFNEIMLSAFTVNKGAFANLKKENVRFYTIEPAFFLFICSDFLIIEPYHSGKIDDDEIGIIGGHVPSFKFKKDSDAYIRLNAHFDNCFKQGAKTLSEVVYECVHTDGCVPYETV